MKKSDLIPAIIVAVSLILSWILPIFVGDTMDKLIELGEPVLLLLIAGFIWKTGDSFSGPAKTLVSCACIMIVFGHPLTRFALYRRVDVTITDKATRINDKFSPKSGGTASHYVVWAKEPSGYTESFVNVDEVNPFLKWNSSDIQGRLEVGGHYHIYVSGIRIPFLSMYRNIISISDMMSEPLAPIESGKAPHSQ